ncbi:hypothetical protein SMATCC274_30100 [Serratia marcescens]|nr:hypothetical protein SMATCC274_30100 [Serratia marcescens]
MSISPGNVINRQKRVSVGYAYRGYRREIFLKMLLNKEGTIAHIGYGVKELI